MTVLIFCLILFHIVTMFLAQFCIFFCFFIFYSFFWVFFLEFFFQGFFFAIFHGALCNSTHFVCLFRCLSPLLVILPKFMYKNVTELNHNKNNNNSKLSRESHDRRLAVGCCDWSRPLMVNYLDRQWTLFLSPINLVWRLSVMDLSFPI